MNAKDRKQEWLPNWLIEKPSATSISDPLIFLTNSRRNLVELCMMCSVILIVHFLAANAARYRKHDISASVFTSRSQRSWLTESEVRRLCLYIGFTIIVTLGAMSVKVVTSTYLYPLLKSKPTVIYGY